ncbi:2-amino-4-hydroxy-6-hydroxymethyldihydropteridine diphosphokinase [Haloactinomyces albus]|uniref:2-amino-4-hydroxy-6-hydroxymethyldihydropteridine diphosphokinase n=1 Tax=Haloactinomyces albus TaxID=1352928 RepID=A0AAE4CLT7_9ACTN|nr:2-amino-4-hydroxy-6-hydroxymethyldihydropteridine diphosphokinase [Haloactinomyces albus]MDR7301691.1 2-amino-4-hydroxy-6-hydroxymethyldihydropteridine diphosphokinase [Haloactinomyces albus]
MSKAVLSLGSNLGDRLSYLRLAVEGLADVLTAASPVYETAAWGVTDQPDFLNAVVLAESDEMNEWDWLHRAQALEREAERRREQRWGPRTLDVDVVAVDAVHSDHPDLLLPHPGTPSRATVLIPWVAVDPAAELPGHGPVTALLGALLGDDEHVGTGVDPGSSEVAPGIHRRDDLTLR